VLLQKTSTDAASTARLSPEPDLLSARVAPSALVAPGLPRHSPRCAKNRPRLGVRGPSHILALMALPKDPAALKARLEELQEAADTAANSAAEAVKQLVPVENMLCEIYRGCDHSRQACAWMSRANGQEEHRLEFMVFDKRLKHVKTLLGMSASVVAAAAGYARMSRDEAVAYGPLIASLDTLSADAETAKAEGWLEGQNGDDEVAAKRAALFDSARWFWSLHGRLADLQYATQDARLEAQEAARVSHKCAVDATATLDEAPAFPTMSAAAGKQMEQVAGGLSAGRATFTEYLGRIAGVFESASATVATVENK
jgi:hypothetical protein